MCGIAGKFFLDKTLFHDSDMDQMLNSIRHRGPDSEGRYSDGRVLLGFRRLSIIDTVSGDQPLYNENKQVVVVANGEIYNYLELKSHLINRGHIFKTASDCEVIVHLYEELGETFIDKLNGMFAFCLYDCMRETLFLCRDRVGIKPLYISRKNNVVFFSSEIKAILSSIEIDPSEGEDVLEEYLCFRSLSGNRTFYSDIEVVPPGVIMQVSSSGLKVSQYWQPKYLDKVKSGFDDISLIQDTLQNAVSRQLMSDVPLGTQLSGGVDSSWVSCLAANVNSEMKSFSVGFNEAGFDETSDAKIVANKARLEYHQVTSDPALFAKLLPKVIWHNDEPLTHANSVEIFNLCLYAREHVKVLLTGEGADELFGGYPRYMLAQFGRYYDRLPLFLRPVVNNCLDTVFKGRNKKPSAYLGLTPKNLVFWNSTFIQPDKVSWLMDKDELGLSSRRDHFLKIWRNNLTPQDNLLLYELQSYLQPILIRQDKMSMGASVEARVPILDNEMVDLALSFSASEKMKHFRPKYLFKKAAIKDVPSQIVNKRKVGFSVPVGSWMMEGGVLCPYLDRVLEQRDDLPGVNPVKLEQLINEQRMGFFDHQDILWPLLNYVVWKDVFLQRGSVYQ